MKNYTIESMINISEGRKAFRFDTNGFTGSTIHNLADFCDEIRHSPVTKKIWFIFNKNRTTEDYQKFISELNNEI
jgi:hypothetical protein